MSFSLAHAVFLVLNYVGLWLGTMTVGAVSDALASSMGVNTRRWGIRSAALAAFIGIAVNFIAARYLRDDLEIGLR